MIIERFSKDHVLPVALPGSLVHIVLLNDSSLINRQYQAPYESELVSNIYKVRGVDDLQV